MPIQRIGSIQRKYRHARRYRHILSVLLKYGFADLVKGLHVQAYVDFGLHLMRSDELEKIERLPRPQRIRMALEELGPAFVKFGQVISTHHELLPQEYISELEKLQDHVPPFPYEEAVAIVERELERPLAELFVTFDTVPLAAASIGQVHTARLHTGEEVVVKIQRPGIRRLIRNDVEVLYHMAELVERQLETLRTQRPRHIVEEFSRIISKEIDYTIEASHLKQFAAQFCNEEGMYVPKVYEEYSTDRVLTMERIRGTKPSSAEVLIQNGHDPKLIARRGFDYILQQIFTFGFFHGDPHPANHLILKNNVICYLDFGMMGRLVQKDRKHFADLVEAIADRDERRATHIAIRLTEWEEEPNHQRLEKTLNDFINQHFNKPLKEMRLGKLLHDLVNILAEHQMRLPRELLLVIKALTTSEGIGRMLDPDFDPIRIAKPVVRSVKRDQLTPKRVLHETREAWTNIIWLLLDAPEEMRRIISMVQRGKMGFDIQLNGIDPLRHTLDRVSNRISLSLLVGALVVGSSIMVHSGIPPTWQGLPIIGVVGFLLAGFISLFLIVSIMRERRR